MTEIEKPSNLSSFRPYDPAIDFEKVNRNGEKLLKIIRGLETGNSGSPQMPFEGPHCIWVGGTPLTVYDF
jgi:hypothetical protein